jgi:hypothetical protein
MKCLDCSLKYIGQTGRAFNNRYKEHIKKLGKIIVIQDTQTTGHKYGIITNAKAIMRTHRKENTYTHSANTIYTRSAKITCK